MRPVLEWFVVACVIVAGCGERPTATKHEAPSGETVPDPAPPKETLEEALLRVNPHREEFLGDKAVSSDVIQSREVRAFLVGAFDFPGALNWSATHSATTIRIYGVVSRAEQDTILRLLGAEYAVRDWRPIHVRFFREQRFETHSSRGGPTVTRRVEVDPLREEWIW
jgi:hypothetical protein